jgi:hypothetical protein
LNHHGIENICKVLFAAQAADVSFRKTNTLGRQNFFPTAKEPQALFRVFKIEQNAELFLSGSKGYAEDFFTLLGADHRSASVPKLPGNEEERLLSGDFS